ncbi:MAG: class I SAM-dependent methyltransferase, partial [Actinobacteria bacterium]|nr:class I SAM-dependent methyltransferase [Actinomycetota bacterium]
MARRWWLIPVAGIGGVLLYQKYRQGGLRRTLGRLDSGEMANPAAYDIYSSVMDGLYTKIALEVVAERAAGRVLDVGCGPGRLDVRLGVMAPSLDVTGVDIDPRMVDLASARAADAGVSRRVNFQVGEAGALPGGDSEFDLVVSSLSLHHWSDPLRGMSEIHRVLKPGGEV